MGTFVEATLGMAVFVAVLVFSASLIRASRATEHAVRKLSHDSTDTVAKP